MGSTKTEKKPASTAFALSLAAGTIILFGGVLQLIFFANFSSSGFGGNMMGPEMMGGGMMGWWTGPWWPMMGGWFLFPLLVLISGIIVLVAALMLNTKPCETHTWGMIMLVFSVIAFLRTGISILGAILGILGGIIALSTKSER